MRSILLHGRLLVLLADMDASHGRAKGYEMAGTVRAGHPHPRTEPPDKVETDTLSIEKFKGPNIAGDG